ncbi:MAG: MazG family protein, partial [Nitriliruptoraceae bacterium]
MTRPGTGPSVALVETSELLPGLLSFPAWDVLGTAERILVRDADRHPFAMHLHLAGLDLETLEPAALDRGDLDLTRPGRPDDRRLAKALVQQALAEGRAVFLLGPEDDRLALALAGMAAEHDLELELVLLAQQPPGTELLRLVEVMQRLRDPEVGCPWDLEQDHHTLLRYLVEETYELVAAVEEGDDRDLEEELGDVLLQIVFHARIAQDRGAFGIDDVARAIADKLVRRHPHVFADGDAATADEVQQRWDELKAAEKGRAGPFDGVPAAAPGLELLTTLQRKAAKRGLLVAEAASSLEAVRAAVDDVAAAAPSERGAAVGDLLDRVVALARELD